MRPKEEENPRLASLTGFNRSGENHEITHSFSNFHHITGFKGLYKCQDRLDTIDRTNCSDLSTNIPVKCICSPIWTTCREM